MKTTYEWMRLRMDADAVTLVTEGVLSEATAECSSDIRHLLVVAFLNVINDHLQQRLVECKGVLARR